MNKILFVLIFVLSIGICFAGDRPDTAGTYLPDVGECLKGIDSFMCVIAEKENSAMLWQFFDTNGDDYCDFVMIFKKLSYRDAEGKTTIFYDFRGLDSNCEKYNSYYKNR